jgi:hypothetical protein
VDSERAERHLRLAAEAGLRRALTLPRYDAELRARDVFIDCIARVQGVATTLIAAGVIDAHRAEVITMQFQAALAVRHRLHPRAAGPLLGPPHRSRPGPHRPAVPGAPGTPDMPGARPARVIPVGRMLPFREQDMAGELYVLSLVITERQAVAPVVARIRRAVHGGGWFPAHSYECIPYGREAGTVPAGLLRWAQETLVPTVNWRTLLAAELCRAVADRAGGGGTDMGAGITAAYALRPRPAIAVVLTDGYTPWPDRAPKGMRVVVALLGDSSPEAPAWARAVRVPAS